MREQDGEFTMVWIYEERTLPLFDYLKEIESALPTPEVE
jgi:hypothetical protein